VSAGTGGGPYIDGTHGFAFPEGPLDEREVAVAFVDELFGGNACGEIGFQHVAPIELGRFCEGGGIFLDLKGALLQGEGGPGGDPQLLGTAGELLEGAGRLGARMGREVRY
jgi:hypothetical protein